MERGDRRGIASRGGGRHVALRFVRCAQGGRGSRAAKHGPPLRLRVKAAVRRRPMRPARVASTRCRSRNPAPPRRSPRLSGDASDREWPGKPMRGATFSVMRVQRGCEPPESKRRSLRSDLKRLLHPERAQRIEGSLALTSQKKRLEVADNVRCTRNTGYSSPPLYSPDRPVPVVPLHESGRFLGHTGGRCLLFACYFGK